MPAQIAEKVLLEERYCELAATRFAQQTFDFAGIAS